MSIVNADEQMKQCGASSSGCHVRAATCNATRALTRFESLEGKEWPVALV